NNVGIMGTNGVYRSRVYDEYLSAAGLSTLYPDQEVQYRMVHPAIYDMEYGIKAMSEPVSMRAAGDLMSVAGMLIKKGAQIIVLGCTEIPLAVTTDNIEGVPLLDAGDILAKALVREAKA
ncbi:MAG: aspartate/glutamate racemase family protein, partial [Bacteroidales bacterium]